MRRFDTSPGIAIPMRADTDAQPFWRFSLDRYGRRDVPPLCLALQEETGADVNLILFGLWLGSEGMSVTETGAARISAVVAEWHAEIVRPLRGVRRRLKGWQVCPDAPREALRAAIQKWEIEAERLEQDMLFSAYEELCITDSTAFAAVPDRATAMAANVERFVPGGPGVADLRQELVGFCL